MKIFSIWDSKAKFYSRPFFLKEKGEAIRAFMDLANAKDNDIARHPEDYSLFFLGEFDEYKGTFLNGMNENLGLASEYVKVEVIKSDSKNS